MVQTITLDDFKARVEATRIQCQMADCTYRGFAIERHLREAHQITSVEYRRQFPGAQLASQMVGELMRRMDRKEKTAEALESLIQPFEGVQFDKVNLENFKKNFTPVTDPELLALIPEEDPYFFFDPEATKGLAIALALGYNTYFEGPMGCGKSELARQVAARLKRPMLEINMHGDATYRTMFGTKDVKDKETKFLYGIVPRAMRLGAILVLNEFDFGPPHVLSALHSVGEHRGKLYLPDTGETIFPKKGFCMIATANTGGKGDANGVYTGTEVLNSATLDRFANKAKMNYLPLEEEEAMLGKRYPAANKAEIKLMVRLAKEVRETFIKGELALTISTRKLVQYFNYLQVGHTQTSALKAIFLNWLDGDDFHLVKAYMDRLQIKVEN